MRRVRIRLRTLLIAVAIAALLFWGVLLGIRSATYTFWASGLTRKRAAYQADIQALERLAATSGLNDREAEGLAYAHRMVEYIDRQQARYKRTAHSPWLATEPDPPPPR